MIFILEDLDAAVGYPNLMKMKFDGVGQVEAILGSRPGRFINTGGC